MIDIRWEGIVRRASLQRSYLDAERCAQWSLLQNNTTSELLNVEKQTNKAIVGEGDVKVKEQMHQQSEKQLMIHVLKTE